MEKCITVDGSAIKEPKNVIAPIGTACKEVIDFAGGFGCEPKKLVMGGPMMGVAQYDLDAPVAKGTSAILAFNEKDAPPRDAHGVHPLRRLHRPLPDEPHARGDRARL